MEQDGLIHARSEMLVQLNRRIYDLLCYPIFFAHAICITYIIFVVYRLYLRSVTSNLKPLRLGVRSFTELGEISYAACLDNFSCSDRTNWTERAASSSRSALPRRSR